jgi:hypothetical protein
VTAALLWLRANALLLKLGAGLALLVALVAWHAHTVQLARQAGTEQESTRRDAIDVQNTLAANRALLAANARLRVAQADLAAAQLDLQKLQQENDREKSISSDRQRRLLAGAERMSVLTRARPSNPAQTGSAAGAAASTVDPGTGVVYDLDPAVAAGLEGIRARHNDAVNRLNACVTDYDQVKAAADAP